MLLAAFSDLTRAELVFIEKDYRLSVQVTPRIGAFNKLIFEESFDGDCKFRSKPTAGHGNWTSYQSQITPVLKEYLSLATKALSTPSSLGIPQWDLIATRTPELPTSYGVSQNCGYGARRAYIEVVSPPGRSVNCEFRVNGVIQDESKPAGACARYLLLDSNIEEIVEVVVTDIADAKHPTKIRGIIPEDFLIVSLGDSYASGEGNPDAPLVDGRPAMWMDPWCHRSAFAGPIQAALMLASDTSKITNPRARAAFDAGAMTIVSFACSGGWVSSSLNGEYEGTIPWDKFLDTYAPSLQAMEQVGGANIDIPQRKISRQLDQLKSLIKTQRNYSTGTAKAVVDLLLLSGGGNDVLFAPLVKAVVIKDIEPKEKQSQISQQLITQFKALDEAYSTFASNLNNLEVSSFPRPVTIRYNSAVVTQYPDPMYAQPDEDCVGTVASNGIDDLDKVVNRVASLFHVLELGGAETDFIRKGVLTPLNEAVRRASNDWLSLAIDRTETDDVRRHGWCKSGRAGYEEQDRWFRQVLDSQRLQGSLHGGYHPTWEFNRKLAAENIARVVRESLNDEPKWDRISLSPVFKRDDGIVFTSDEPRFAYDSERKEAPKPQVSKLGARQVVLCDANESNCASEKIGNHGTVAQIVGQASHPTLKRSYPPVPLVAVHVDASPPRLNCEVSVQEQGGIVWKDCAVGWARNSDAIRFTATDFDSGMAEIKIVSSQEPSAAPYVPVSESVTAQQIQRIVRIDQDGIYQIGACARDKVNNWTGQGRPKDCAVMFSVRVDSNAPEIKRFDVYDINWIDHPEPVIPLFRGVKLPAAKLVMQDSVSGMTSCWSDSDSTQLRVCEMKLDRTNKPLVLWDIQNFEEKFSDTAGNATTFLYSTIVLPKPLKQAKPMDWASWRNRLSSGDSEATKALWAVSKIVPTLDAKLGVSAPNFPEVYAAWLNMATGNISPEEIIESRLTETCNEVSTADWISRPALSLLRVITKCGQSALGANTASPTALITIMSDAGFIPAR